MQKILIVDDNSDDIEIARVALAEKGWDLEVEACRQAEKALEFLRKAEELPSLLLLDINIPGMGGIACLREIRADERLRPIPVIMVTASSFEADEKRAYEAGADFFLFKEFDMDRFGEKLDAALKRLMA